MFRQIIVTLISVQFILVSYVDDSVDNAVYKKILSDVFIVLNVACLFV